MATEGEDKIGVTHADFIEPAAHHSDGPDTHQDGQDGSGSDDIVEALQHTGEEVGMTWRSFMAAAVSPSPGMPVCEIAVVLIWDDLHSQWPCRIMPISSLFSSPQRF